MSSYRNQFLIYLMGDFHLNGGYSAGSGPLDFLLSFYLNREFHLTQGSLQLSRALQNYQAKELVKLLI